MSTLNRHMVCALAAFVLAVAGCGGADDAERDESRSAADDRRAAVVSEFERALDEARYLRDDIAALREDMRAVRDTANEEVRRASRDASVLRDEIAAIRLEMQQLSDAAASEAERSAEEARTLRDEIAALRDELISAREAAESAEGDSGDFSVALSEADEYPAPIVYDDEIGSGTYSPQRRAGNAVRVIYGPTYRQRPLAAPRRGYGRDPRRSSRSRDVKRQVSNVTRTKPAARTRPHVSPAKAVAPRAPGVTDTRPQAPSTRPMAPAARPAAPISRP
ncbi:MAG: hypothetical protein OXF94_06515, partial [Gammaproteobacteria bacterium]|nr:hypothetical protein [Gammaproteobacteria bacterium]